MMLQKILAAVDCTQQSEAVVTTMCSLDPSATESVTLLHVVDDRVNGKTMSADITARFENHKEKLRRQGFPVNASIVQGVPFDVIVHEAQVSGATLTAIGRATSPQWKTRIMGETALRVLELCPSPVLTCCNCRTEDRALFSDVLFCSDFSNEAFNALRELKRLLSEKKVSVGKATLLHVHEQRNIDMLLKFVTKERIDQVNAVERERLEETAQGLSEAGIPDVSVRMRTGKSVDEILSDIREHRPTLAILGAQGVGNSDMYRIGTTAFRITQMAECSVLVVPMPRTPLPL